MKAMKGKKGRRRVVTDTPMPAMPMKSDMKKSHLAMSVGTGGMRMKGMKVKTSDA